LDLAAMARAQGLVGEGPITEARDLAKGLAAAIAAVESGASYVLDVVVPPREASPPGASRPERSTR
jgi:hypothetical protein